MFYICIPARNEEETIGPLLWKIRGVLGEFRRDYQVLVLDDASSDGTADAVERYRRSLPVTLIREPDPVGYAKALERLLREAAARSDYPKRDAAIVFQADFSESPDSLVPLIKAIEGGADIVAAVPTPGTDSDGGLPPRERRLVRWGARVLLGRAIRGAPISDPLSGLRAYRIVVLRKLLRERPEGGLIRSQGWAGNLELLAAMAPFARRIEEVPGRVRYNDLPRPTRFRPWDSFKALAGLRGTIRWPAPAGTPSPGAVPQGSGEVPA